MPVKDPEVHGVSSVVELQGSENSNTMGGNSSDLPSGEEEHQPKPEQPRRSFFWGRSSSNMSSSKKNVNDNKDENEDANKEKVVNEEKPSKKKKKNIHNADSTPSPPGKLMFYGTHLITLVALGLHAAVAFQTYRWLTDSPLECCEKKSKHADDIVVLPLFYLGLVLLEVCLVVASLGLCRVFCGGCFTSSHSSNNGNKKMTADPKARDNGNYNKDPYDPYQDNRTIDNLENDFDDNNNNINNNDPPSFSFYTRALYWTVVLNSYLGCSILLMLFYMDRDDLVSIWFLEAVAAVLWAVALRLSRRRLQMEWVNGATFMFRYVLPWIPILVVAYIMFYYVGSDEHGGVCYRSGDDQWDVSGCELCTVDGLPPSMHDSGTCPGGSTSARQDSYCGPTQAEQFCYFHF